MIIKDLDIKIKSIISENNWTQEKLSEYLGISKRNLNNIIETKEVIKLDLFLKLSRVLNLSPTYLFSQIIDNKESNDSRLEHKRMVVEVELETISNEFITRAYAVPYQLEESYLSIKLSHELQDNALNIFNFRFPHYKKIETKTFYSSKDFTSFNMGIIFNHGDYLICTKLESKDEIENGHFYVTVNSLKGRDFSKLYVDSESSQLNFCTIEYNDNSEPFDKINYSLSKEEVYEVWKLEILVKNSIYNPLNNIYCEELKVF